MEERFLSWGHSLMTGGAHQEHDKSVAIALASVEHVLVCCYIVFHSFFFLVLVIYLIFFLYFNVSQIFSGNNELWSTCSIFTTSELFASKFISKETYYYIRFPSCKISYLQLFIYYVILLSGVSFT